MYSTCTETLRVLYLMYMYTNCFKCSVKCCLINEIIVSTVTFPRALRSCCMRHTTRKEERKILTITICTCTCTCIIM